MFVRKKKNRSGVISVQVIDKSSGSYKLVKTIGSSADPKTVEKLYLEGQNWIEDYSGQLTIDFSKTNMPKKWQEVLHPLRLLVLKY